MKKFKKASNNSAKSLNIRRFKPEIKCSRVTISSNICNDGKFDELFKIIDSTKDFKNTASNYCFENLLVLITNYSGLLKDYRLFGNAHLNAWERQNIFQEVASHYYETSSRYLSKADYVVKNNINKIKTDFSSLVKLINKNSNLIKENENSFKLDFDVNLKIVSLNTYLEQYKKELLGVDIETKEGKETAIKLEKSISSYKNIISTYEKIKVLVDSKPIIYDRTINLIISKKLRLISKVKLGTYQTGTHARHLDNAQLSIVRDLSNVEYQYFLKLRRSDKLTGREPKPINKELLEELKLIQKAKTDLSYEEKLAKYNKDNFIYLPLSFNEKKLKAIGKTINNILSKDSPQILIKSEQLRINQSSRKIHLIFNYEEDSKLGLKIESNQFVEPTEDNTLGLDVNLKHNLLVDSRGTHYDELLGEKDINGKNKSRFTDNLNEIVLLQSKAVLDRTLKEKYRYEKLLRTNQSLIKTYLSGLIKDWKSKNIMHLVLEDLNFHHDKSYYEHQGVQIKYSRLARLLRLSQIKLWVSGMAEKQGLFTHLVNPAYTSQECSCCHHISHLNRVKQETFKCTNDKCEDYNVEKNADEISALNIKNRILNKKLRLKLGKDNVYFCSQPNKIYYKKIKSIVEKVYNGVVTELLPKELVVPVKKKPRHFTQRAYNGGGDSQQT